VQRGRGHFTGGGQGQGVEPFRFVGIADGAQTDEPRDVSFLVAVRLPLVENTGPARDVVPGLQLPRQLCTRG
jgi:hypothetical protein